MNGLRKKRGQVTIFIILALVIVGIAILIYFLSPGIRIGPGGESGAVFDEQNPYAFLNFCANEKIKEVVETVSLQGGSLNPEHTIMYQGINIEYLCYTNEYYIPCNIQRPFLEQHIEAEIWRGIKSEIDVCFNQLEQNYIQRGYTVNIDPGISKVELLPKRISISLEHVLNVRKGSDIRTYDSFSISLDNNLYELVNIASDIIEWEAVHGDFETLYHAVLSPNIRLQKQKQLDGTTIYILEDRETENKFQFASRGLAWCAGYCDVSVFPD